VRRGGERSFSKRAPAGRENGALEDHSLKGKRPMEGPISIIKLEEYFVRKEGIGVLARGFSLIILKKKRRNIPRRRKG